MRRIVMLSVCVAAFAALGMAESWSGRLVDANCAAQKADSKNPSCDANVSTTAFAVDVSGKLYKFDDAGNSKAMQALKSRADREKEPNAPATPMKVTVTGTKEGEIIKVDKVDVS
ncbi:MAG TPA: hypothetical protein VGF59_27510 [Bryobacteraceae bacterium]|jgi:hypothetical protein